MADRQPLLSTSHKALLDDHDDGDNQQPSIKNMFRWRQWFPKKKKDDDKDVKRDALVSFYRMFRFADRIDFVLMFLSICFVIVGSLFFTVNLTLAARLAGLFALESFGNKNSQHFQNSVDTLRNNITCPLGINLNSDNFGHLHKLCRHADTILLTTLTAPVSSLREKLLQIIHRLLITGIIAGLCVGLSILTWLATTKRQISRMNILLFRSLLQRNILYFDTTQTGQFNSELFANIETIEKGIGFDYILCQFVTASMIWSLIVSFTINWKLSLIMLCIVPIVFGISFMFSKIIANQSLNNFKAYSKVGQIVEEVFSSLRTVLAFNGDKYEQKRYAKELDRTRWHAVRKGAIYGLFVGWLNLTAYIVYSVGFIFGSILMSYVHENTFNISDILAIVFVFAQVIGFMGYAASLFQSFSEAKAAATTVFRLIDEAENTSINEADIWRDDDTSDAKSTPSINGDIEFDAVNFIYPSRQDVSVLRNLTLVAREGQTTALVGSSGCGKSTCISLLNRQYEPSSGRINIGDRSIANFNLKQLRQNIGVVSQEPILFGMSIYENIRFGKVNATRAEVEEAARQANAHNFIMELPNKYETFVGERGIQLSGGQKQRIALARALVKQPSILLLDEATSALDNVSEKIVQEALDRACQNRTTIVIAHRLSTIRNAHQIYVLNNGSVIEEGTHETLMGKEGGKYQTMVRKQELKRMNDDKDSLMTIEQAIEEDRQSNVERIRSVTDSETADTHKESSPASKESTFRKLLSMNKPEWKIILTGCLICVISGAVKIGFAILLTKIVNAFKHSIPSQRQHQVLIDSLLFLLLGVVLLILEFLQYTIFAMAGSQLVHRIRLKAFACLLRQETAYFDRPENSSSAISVRLSSDAAAIEQMVGTRIGAICEVVALSLVALICGLFFSWQLTMIVLVSILIITCFAYVNIYLSMRVREKSSLILERANMFVVEVIHNIRTLKQLSVENEVLRQYSESIHQISRMFWKLNALSAMLPAVIEVFEPYFFSIVYWCAFILYKRNELALDNITMVFAFVTFGMEFLKVAQLLPNRIGSSLSGAQNFFNLFDRTPSIDNASTDGEKLVDFRGEIQFDEVKFVYPTRRDWTVLKRVQLTIKSGQRVALVGTSGCGKSTIIQLLERFYDVTRGQVLLDGIDIRQLNIQWVRSRLGLVSQEPILFDLTIAENIAYGLENIPMDDIINAAIKANIHDFIQQLPQGYETRVGLKGGFLSGGEKQRVAIARVLVRRPKVLLFDEATSALDSYNEQIVQEALERAQIEDPTRTSLIIAHRLSTIRSCDLICVLDNGRIVESGTHTELVEHRGLYYEMLNQHSS